MKMNNYRNLTVLIALTLLLSACGGSATPDAAAIATSAVQTVEARYTQQAAQQPTETSTATLAAIPASETPTMLPATSTKQPLDSNGKPCYAASVQDVTIPDGMIVAPGSTFTKTWRLLNEGNCVWDSSYALIFDSGDAMGTVVKVPLTTKVYPEQSIDISVALTAPAADGVYTGYWRMATPFGGTFGVGKYDQSIYVQITVSSKPNRDEGVSNVVVGLYERKPQNGCSTSNIAAAYTFSAVITANTAIEVVYHWNRLPYDGSKPEGGKLTFKEAGSKTVYFTWNMQHESVQNIDRSVSLEIDNPGTLISQKVHFNFTCDQ